MFKAQGVQLEEQRQEILKRLESKQERASRDADEFNEKHTAVMKILDQLRAGIESLFDKINCDKNSIDDMLGTNTGVTDSNMLQYLGVIEERTNELLLTQAYVNFHKVGARSVMFLTSSFSGSNGLMLSLQDYDEFSKRQPSLLGEGPQPVTSGPTIHPPGIGCVAHLHSEVHRLA